MSAAVKSWLCWSGEGEEPVANCRAVHARAANTAALPTAFTRSPAPRREATASVSCHTASPTKPVAAALESGQGVRRGRGGTGGPPPAPPMNVKEDPRAQAGKKVSYVDVDQVAEGDVELTY